MITDVFKIIAVTDNDNLPGMMNMFHSDALFLRSLCTWEKFLDAGVRFVSEQRFSQTLPCKLEGSPRFTGIALFLCFKVSKTWPQF